MRPLTLFVKYVFFMSNTMTYFYEMSSLLDL